MSAFHNTALIGGSGQGGYFINNSLRFRSSASAYLNRTSGTPTSGSIFTHSFWIKRGTLGAQQSLIAGQRPTNFDRIYFESDNTLFYQWNDGTSNLAYVQTTQVFRDPSAWYHIVVSTDTTQATASNRVKIYINGVQVTALTSTTYPTQNSTSYFNTNAVTLNIGRSTNAAMYFDGYMGEINFVDGQALTPSSFGETDTLTGQWVPKKYAGTYGTNGFYLKFADTSDNTAATIGKDSSGNGNNWTPNNISKTAGVTYDFMTDSPTVGPLASNYATWNPLRKDNNASISLANGNLAASGTTYPSGAFLSTIAAQTSGLFYAEFTLVGAQWPTVAVADVTVPNICPSGSMSVSGVVAWDNSNYFINGTTVASGLTMNNGDVIGVAFDAATRKVWFAQNNTWVSSGNPAAGTNERGIVAGTGSLAFACRSESTVVIHANFGQRPFSYTPPTGYSALNTYNLSAPTIRNGAQYMAANTYTGTGATQVVTNTVNGTSMQPDFLWQKSRSAARDHRLIDTVRGIANTICSDLTQAEYSGSILSSVNSNGFTLNTADQGNNSAETYVAWQWKAGGGTSVTNTSGTISSQVSANPTAGFSIVTYTETSGSYTIGHGLGVAPSMFILKERNSVSNWVVWHNYFESVDSIPTTKGMYLNATNTPFTTGSNWLNSISSTTIGITAGQITGGSSLIVLYAFSAVAGYSAFGSYTGNGSSDGVFVFLGFRARFLMIKRTDSTGGWVMLDTARDTYNDVDNYLYANSNATDAGSSNVLDINSNGFKIRNSWTDINASGGTYIYMAFAENPFKYSNAR